MAGSNAYVSFPRFTRQRQSIMSTTCRRLIEALMMLSGTSSCFPRPGSVSADDSSQDASQSKTANGKFSAIPQPERDLPAGQQSSAHLCRTKTHEYHLSDPKPITRQTTSSSTTTTTSTTITSPPSSLLSLPNTLRASLNRRISSWRSDHPPPWPLDATAESTGIQTFTSEEDEATTITTTSESKNSSNKDFIASLDALALSQHEREVLGRMELVVESAKVAREQTAGARQDRSHGDDMRNIEPAFRLRGGGDDEVLPFRALRRRTTLPVEDPVFPKADSYRPPRGLWWFAGGRGGLVPSLGELRVRKEVERANRSRVGFWGTVLGVRRVGRVGILGVERGCGGGGGVDGEGDAEGSVGGLGDVEAGSLHGGRSVGSIVRGSGAGGGGGGGSLASSHREQEIEADQPVHEAKARSMMSVANADRDPGHGNEDVMDEPAEDHKLTESGSVKDAGVEEPEAESESAKSVAGDRGSTQSRETREAGIGESKARFESARSVAEDHESTKTGGVADTGVDEPRGRTESVAEDAARAEVWNVRSRERGAGAETENMGEGESKSSKDG